MLAAHVALVLFVVMGLLLTLIGGAAGWTWVRGRVFRVGHALLIAYIVVQTWLGADCPLTVWENGLRAAGGQRDYGDLSFVGYWLRQILFYEAEPWVFVAGYTVFGLLVLASWWWVPVRWQGSSRKRRRGEAGKPLHAAG